MHLDLGASLHLTIECFFCFQCCGGMSLINVRFLLVSFLIREDYTLVENKRVPSKFFRFHSFFLTEVQVQCWYHFVKLKFLIKLIATHQLLQHFDYNIDSFFSVLLFCWFYSFFITLFLFNKISFICTGQMCGFYFNAFQFEDKRNTPSLIYLL